MNFCLGTAFAAGLLLGAFFGGLWWTIIRAFHQNGRRFGSSGVLLRMSLTTGFILSGAIIGSGGCCVYLAFSGTLRRGA
jgi:hypothetical protein